MSVSSWGAQIGGLYRTSFVSMTLAQFVITGLEFVAILIMFAHVPALGGFGLDRVFRVCRL